MLLAVQNELNIISGNLDAIKNVFNPLRPNQQGEVTEIQNRISKIMRTLKEGPLAITGGRRRRSRRASRKGRRSSRKH